MSDAAWFRRTAKRLRRVLEIEPPDMVIGVDRVVSEEE
jgi:hypothetical protein